MRMVLTHTQQREGRGGGFCVSMIIFGHDPTMYGNCVSGSSVSEREKTRSLSYLLSIESQKTSHERRQASQSKSKDVDDPKSNEKTQSCDFFEFFFTNIIEWEQECDDSEQLICNSVKEEKEEDQRREQ